MNNHRNYVLVSLKALVAAVLLVAAAFTLYLYIGGFDDDKLEETLALIDAYTNERLAEVE